MKTLITFQQLIDNALPCPFCGEKTIFDKDYCPAMIGFRCNNDECYVKPSIYVEVKCTPQDESCTTFTPEFEQHYKELLDKWNKRV